MIKGKCFGMVFNITELTFGLDPCANYFVTPDFVYRMWPDSNMKYRLIKIQSKNLFAHNVNVIITTAHHISFVLLSIFIHSPIPHHNLTFFFVKPPSVTHKKLSSEMFYKEQKAVAYFQQNYKFKWCLYSNFKQFQVFEISTFEFKVTVNCHMM